jgi:hypothetical protein
VLRKMPQINRQQLIIEFKAAEPFLIKEVDSIIRKQLFEPKVKELQEAYEEHLITKEIKGEGDSPNISGTIPQDSRSEGQKRRNDETRTRKNLWNFIGFDAGSNPLEEIENRLDPKHANKEGPTLEYVQGSARDKIEWRFKVQAPNLDKIKANTPFPDNYLSGSWLDKIEHGFPGLSHFLNAIRRNSRSGGGIQVESSLRDEEFKPQKYLTKLFGDFINSFK